MCSVLPREARGSPLVTLSGMAYTLQERAGDTPSQTGKSALCPQERPPVQGSRGSGESRPCSSALTPVPRGLGSSQGSSEICASRALRLRLAAGNKGPDWPQVRGRALPCVRGREPEAEALGSLAPCPQSGTPATP